MIISISCLPILKTKVLEISRLAVPPTSPTTIFCSPFSSRYSGFSAPLQKHWVQSCLRVFVLGVLSPWNSFPSDTHRTHFFHPSVSLNCYLIKPFLDTIVISTLCPPSFISFHSTYLSIHLFTICFLTLDYKLLEGRNICFVCWTQFVEQCLILSNQ